jgi:predicted phosphodiesterase
VSEAGRVWQLVRGSEPVADLVVTGGDFPRIRAEVRPAAGFAAVVSGHSHVPEQHTRNGVLYFNPGSAGPRRFKLPVSVGKLLVANGAIRSEILPLEI